MQRGPATLRERFHHLHANGLDDALHSEAIELARAHTDRRDLRRREPAGRSPRTLPGRRCKNAQEAHEAIRPAGEKIVTSRPNRTRQRLGVGRKAQDLRVDLVKRTVACQMKDARGHRTVLKVARRSTPRAPEPSSRRPAKTVEFPGFRLAYVEDVGGSRRRRSPDAGGHACSRTVVEGRRRRDATKVEASRAPRPQPPARLDRSEPWSTSYGSAWHRPAVDLRLDHRHHPAPGVLVQEGLGLGTDLHRVRGGGPDGAAPLAPDRSEVHRQDGRAFGRHLPGRGRNAALPAGLLRQGHGGCAGPTPVAREEGRDDRRAQCLLDSDRQGRRGH